MVLCMPKHYNVILGMWLITLLKLFRHAVFCYVYYTFLCPYKLCNLCFFRCSFFSNSILFRWISVIPLNFCCSYHDCLTRHFKGHMKILASALYHKSHYPESHYQHSISNGIGITKISFFSCKFFLEKIEHLSHSLIILTPESKFRIVF